MYRGDRARIFPVIIVLVVIAIAIAALVSVGRAIFGGGDQPSTTPDTSQQALLNSSDTHSVRMTVRGKIVADENFRSYQVLVTPSSRTLTTYSGYLAQPITASQLGNNVKAYEEFTHALDKANLAKGTAFSGDQDDIRGVCASGSVYEFDIMDNNNTIKHLWTSDCKGSSGSLKASVKQLQSLFLGQVPDQKSLLSKIDL
jgi:FlaG/FlaF family flagellin (archaellin)